MMYLKCDKCNHEQNMVMLKCRCETEPSEVSSAGLLSGVEVERLFCLAVINVLTTDQVAAVLQVYNEKLKPNAKEILAGYYDQWHPESDNDRSEEPSDA